MHSAGMRPPEPRDRALVGGLYRRTPIPEVPSTPAKRLVLLASLGVLALAIVLAIVS